MAKKLTTETFIAKAIKKHGNKYNYDKVVYIDSQSKVIVTCKIHGDFSIRPAEILRGKGCAKCSGKHRWTTEEWIALARKAHGNKYSYNKSKYINASTRITITCPDHGDFEQLPGVHVYQESGCPKCAPRNFKYTQEEWINKANEIHNNKYDYSKLEYKSSQEKVLIICPEHGEFWQIADDHINKPSGCPKCKGVARLTTEEFIKRAKEIHGDKYIYDKVNYINQNTNVIIICPKHGEFTQMPVAHIHGLSGCSKCSQNYTLTKQEFLEKVNKVHNNFYNYDLLNYKNGKSKIKIICPKHGEFVQQASEHSYGKGCAKCGTERMVKSHKLSLEEWVERANEVHDNYYDYSLISKDKLKNQSSKVPIICPEHGVFYQCFCNHVSQKQGCPVCGRVTAGQSHATQLSEVLEEARQAHGEKYDYSLITKDNYKNKSQKVKIICPEHGIFEQSMTNHTNQKQGCPSCRESHGEKSIARLLEKADIKHIREKRFDECKHKNSLPFDFFLPELNILIEYDGEQHFKPLRFLDKVRAEKKLKELQDRDKIKTKWAKDSPYTLYRITYKENVEDKMNEIIEDSGL